VDLQFLDHIRRGTSINMMDLAPGPTPQNLEEALSLLSVTGGWLHVLTPLLGIHVSLANKRDSARNAVEDLIILRGRAHRYTCALQLPTTHRLQCLCSTL
jgi:hypothetical protein